MPDAVDVQFPWEDSPRRHHTHDLVIPDLKVDKYPVSNQDYKAFLDSSGWAPAQKQNWLRHWANNTFLEGQAKKPVIWVSHGDAEAYCAYYGARLPHTWEWQWFAQGIFSRSV